MLQQQSVKDFSLSVSRVQLLITVSYVLYQDEKSIYSKMYKGLKMTPLEP